MNILISNALPFVKKNHKPILLFILSLCNLLYMHYYIISTCNIEAAIDFTSYIDNFTSVFIETLCIFLVIYFVSCRNSSFSITSTFFITLIWSFCNILYSRFFLRYITFSSIGQAGNLMDWDMIKCIIDGFRWSDLYYITISFFYYFIYRHCSFSKINRKLGISITFFLASIILADLMAHVFFCLTNNLRYITYYTKRVYGNHIEPDHNFGRPNWVNFHRGSVRTLFAEELFMYGKTINLDEEQIEQIQKRIERDCTFTQHELHPEIKNIIFILVESYVSFVTDLKIDEKNVMPFLHSLSKEANVFYNGSMLSNITLGQSSDGQFIYMSGLLPLRSVITISKAKNNTIPGLPQKLKEKYPQMVTRMVIPTLPSLWEQETMCNVYGFDELYTSNDYPGEHSQNLSDHEVFDLASKIDKSAKQPFFSIILTMTMHSPYNKIFDPDFHINNKKYDEDFICYLNACHYTDKQMEKYFSHLKESGLYNNSLIIIASDHQVLENFLDVEKYGFDRHLPLFLINGNIDKGHGWNGECNQVDVYTTILDIINAKSKWQGLGRSILSPKYNSSIDNNDWKISEWILFGNYFKKHPY